MRQRKRRRRRKKQSSRQWWMAHAFNPSTQKAGSMQISQFETSLVYKMSFRVARAAQKTLLSKTSMFQLGLVVHVYNPNRKKVETGRLRVHHQPRIYSVTCHNTKKKHVLSYYNLLNIFLNAKNVTVHKFPVTMFSQKRNKVNK